MKCHKYQQSAKMMKTAFFCGGSKTRAENSNCWQGDVSSKSYRESRNDSVLARDPERNDTEWLQCSVSGGKYADKGQWISFKSKPSINPARERHGSYWSVGRLKSTPSFPSSLSTDGLPFKYPPGSRSTVQEVGVDSVWRVGPWCRGLWETVSALAVSARHLPAAQLQLLHTHITSQLRQDSEDSPWVMSKSEGEKP